MTDQSANLPMQEPGFPLKARDWNELVQAIAGVINVSGDVIGGMRPGLFSMAVKRNSELVRDVATIGLIRADDTEGAADLEAFKPAGINEATFNTDLPNLNRRVMICEPALPQHFGKWVIPLRDIKPGFLGPAIINGLALVKYKTLFDKEALNRVDIWGDEDVLTENIVGMGEFIHDEGKAIGTEQFAFIRMTARPDNVVRVSVSAGADVGQPVYPNGGLVGDGTPAMKLPDDDYKGNSLIVVGKDIGGENTTGWACVGTCLAQVDDAGASDDDFGAEDAETTLIKDNTGYRSLGSVGSTGGTAYIIARPFCPHLIKADGVNSLDEQNPDAVNEADGTMVVDLASGDEKAVAVHFLFGPTQIDGCYVIFTTDPEFTSELNNSDTLLFQSLQLKGQLIIDDFAPAAASWNLIMGLTLKANFSVHATFDVTGGITNSSGGSVFPVTGIDLPPGLTEQHAFAIWLGRDAFRLTDVEIDAGKKIHGILLELIPTNNYNDGTATATVDPDLDKKTLDTVLDIGGDR